VALSPIFKRNPETTRSRNTLFSFAALLVSIVTLELGSMAIYRIAVSNRHQQNIAGLTNSGSFRTRKLPNTFWHHEFNPQHPIYDGQLNSYGLKGAEFAMPKPQGELRVLCVGDSTVESTGVALEETFPHYLEGILQEQLHRLPGYKTVKVINGGIGSQNSAFNLAHLAFRLIHFDPDVVVIKSSYNDYLPYIVPGMERDYTHAFPNPYHQRRISAYWSLARYSYFLRLVGLVTFRDEVAVPFPDFSGHLTREQFQEMEFSGNADKFFVYAENIRSMILLTRGRGMDVLIVDLPVSQDPNHFGENGKFGAGFRKLIRRLELELENVTQEEQIPFVRTGPFESTDFWDHVHGTASGNRKVAEGVAEALLKTVAAHEAQQRDKGALN
jgi:lysophospholipase L1-like esterase